MSDVLKKFGRYFLLDHIAQGGMAEIYRARLIDADGAGRLIVIKKIQAGFGDNSEFLKMFKSEIKVTMGFNHPNIVQLYDFGEEDHQPYIAMEWIDGRNLRQLTNRYIENKRAFPIELAATIVEQAAAGLHYAHSYRDKISGEHLNIVHRDISPQNIIISFEGIIKVIDFGIAKATTNNESTRAGIIKGKPSYLSPEQISGENLDARSDVFALGAVLWEILTGKKLFAADNDLAVLKLIENCSSHVKPPSTLNPKIPKELDAIVMKSLTKQRNNRYQTAEEFQRALHKFITSYSPEFNSSDIAGFVKDVFKPEILEDRKHIQKISEKASQLLILPAEPAPVEPPKHKRIAPETFDFTEETSKNLKVEFEGSHPTTSRAAMPSRSVGAEKSRILSREIVQRAEKKSRSSLILIILLGMTAIAGGLSVFTKKEEQPEIPTPIKEPVKVLLEKSLMLSINIIPQPSLTSPLTLFFNNKLVDIFHPTIEASLDTPLEIRIERSGLVIFKRSFVLESSRYEGEKETTMECNIESSHMGYLTLHTTPSSDVNLMVDGANWTKKTPIENEPLPVGSYNARLVNTILGMEKVISIKIEEGKTVTIDERLDVK